MDQSYTAPYRTLPRSLLVIRPTTVLYCERCTSATDCGGGSASSGKPLGMHTLNSPLFSSSVGPPAIIVIAPSVVQDVLFSILPDFVHSWAASSSASTTSGFNLYCSSALTLTPSPTPYGRGLPSPAADFVFCPPRQDRGGNITVPLVGAGGC